MKEFGVEFIKVWKEDIIGNIVTVLFTVLSYVYVQIQKSGIQALSLSDGFMSNIFPTLGGAIVAFTFSDKPLKQRWRLILASALFNAYALEGILLYFKIIPSGTLFFFGGISAYYIIDLFILTLKEVPNVIKNVLEHIAPSINRWIEKKLDIKKDDNE